MNFHKIKLRLCKKKEHLKVEEVMDQKVQQVATKCNINLTSLFQSSLCRAACGHCDEVGQYQIHLVDFDLTSKVVSMECTACRWTTVRQMTFTTKVVGWTQTHGGQAAQYSGLHFSAKNHVNHMHKQNKCVDIIVIIHTTPLSV